MTFQVRAPQLMLNALGNDAGDAAHVLDDDDMSFINLLSDIQGPSTCAQYIPSERTFSVAGTISKRRGGGTLSRKTLSYLTLLQRATREKLQGKKRLTRAKRSRKDALPSGTGTPVTFPLFASPATSRTAPVIAALPVPIAPPSASAFTMDELSEEFEARLEADAEKVQAMIDAGQLAFIVGDQGDLALLEPEDDLTGLTIDETSSRDSDAEDADHVLDDDDMSFDKLLSDIRGEHAAEFIEIDSEAAEVLP